MRKFHLLQLALAGLLFAGCSSDDLTDGGNSQSSKTKGYVSLAINLPSTASTRAGWDDESKVFDDGEESEYSIKDAHAYFFDANNNIVAVSEAEEISETSTAQNQNVTKTATFTIDARLTPASVLVVLNAGGGFPTTYTALQGQTFNYLNTALTQKSVSDFATEFNTTTGAAKDIMMANAPIVVSDKVQTLVPVSEKNIFAEKDKASQNPVTVYVERLLAKVTVNENENMTTPSDATVTFTGWDLDVTNTATYPVRIMKDDWLVDDTYATNGINRFYGTATNPKRTYFAEDPNYSSYVTGDFTTIDQNKTLSYNVGNTGKYIGYCLENTFNTANMNKNQTTSVLLKAIYTPTEISTGTTLEGYNASTNNNIFLYGVDRTLYSSDRIANLIKQYVINNGVVYGLDVDANSITVSTNKLKALTASSEVLQLDATYFTGVTVKTGETANWTGLSNALAIKVYAASECYYTVQIKHFGDALTPWTSGATYTDAAHLGRYGVVRNNWYDLTINSVSAIGTPVPETPEEPDDYTPEYKWIKFSINVLSWAKRSQGVDL